MSFTEFGVPQLVVVLVALQRMAELTYARHNTKRLLALGGIEISAGHYPALVALHGAWLLALYISVPAEAETNGWLIGVFVLLQLGRLWVIASLGRYWTTRIIAVPGAALITRGPYRYLRHPNYLIVLGEIAILPLAFGAWALALGFSLANMMVLAIRWRVEEAALAPRRLR